MNLDRNSLVPAMSSPSYHSLSLSSDVKSNVKSMTSCFCVLCISLITSAKDFPSFWFNGFGMGGDRGGFGAELETDFDAVNIEDVGSVWLAVYGDT